MCPQDLRPGVIASLFPSLEKPEGVWYKFVLFTFWLCIALCHLCQLMPYFLEPLQSYFPYFRFDLLFNVKCLWSYSSVNQELTFKRFEELFCFAFLWAFVSREGSRISWILATVNWNAFQTGRHTDLVLIKINVNFYFSSAFQTHSLDLREVDVVS